MASAASVKNCVCSGGEIPVFEMIIIIIWFKNHALCIFTGCSTSNVQKSLWCNVEGIHLSAADKDIIVNNKWLSDKHIDAASRLLKRDFKVRGLVDSLAVTHRTLITQRVFECIPNSTQLMQIHPVKHHWLLSSCINGSVMVSN